MCKDKNKVFYCEIKSPLHLVNEATKMYHWTTSMSKLRGFIHKAVQQFQDFDQNHNYPWVIAFTSDHFQLNWTSMIHALQGVVSFNGTIVRDLRKERYIIETIEDVGNIDMYIWSQINPKKNNIYQMKIVLNKKLPLFKKTKEISELLKSKPDKNIQFLSIDEVFL